MAKNPQAPDRLKTDIFDKKHCEPFKRHPAAIAIDEWLASPEGITCLCGSASGVYLKNRLRSAFQAGFNAGHQFNPSGAKP